MDDATLQSSITQSPSSYLLTSIAKSHLGEVALVIVSQLISHGRLSSRDISNKTKLPIQVVKSALVSLVQLNCVFYWKTEKAYLYSFNQEGLLILLHSGDIITHIKNQYGEESAEIIQNVLIHGHVKMEEYLGNITDPNVQFEKQTLFFKLFSDRWLVRLQPFHYHPLEDVWNKLFEETAKATPRNSTVSEVKRLADVKERTKVKFELLMQSGQTPKDLYLTQDGIKRLQPNLCIRFNLSRYSKSVRTNSLVNLARARIGILLAKIYEIALRSIEQNSPDLTHDFLEISGLINDPEEERTFINSIENKLVDDKKIVFNVRDLQRLLPEEIDLRGSILTQKMEKRSSTEDDVERSTKKIKIEANVKVEGDEELALALFEASNNVVEGDSPGFTDDQLEAHSITLIEHHLQLLSASTNVQFLIEMTPGTYTVPYTSLDKLVKEYNFDTLIKTTLGSNAFRVLKCLKSLKLGDEKSISNAVLLKEKTVRNEIYKLILLNCVEIQEIPRSADRAASKTFYLFRHKEGVSYRFLSNSILYSMSQILTNVEAFKEDHQILLDKCEREDVKGHEEELLLDSELKTLKGLQLREVNNIGRFQRLKGLYDVFSA